MFHDQVVLGSIQNYQNYAHLKVLLCYAFCLWCSIFQWKHIPRMIFIHKSSYYCQVSLLTTYAKYSKVQIKSPVNILSLTFVLAPQKLFMSVFSGLPLSVTEDGFEYMFAVNYWGHFLLTNLLLGKSAFQ